MSTLTKILIILLAFASIFLCGIVVTYVANADSYRQKFNELTSEKDNLSKKIKELTKQISDKTDHKKQMEEKLSGEITSLKTRLGDIETSLKNSEREKAALLAKVDSWTSITKDFYETNDKQGQLLKSTLEELNKVQTEQAKNRKELNEVSAALVEKTAVLESLEAEKRRLLEEKTELQNKMDQITSPAGRTVKAPVPVTPKKESVRPAASGEKEVALQGTVTAVDLKNSMASISVGKADGVREGMKFHVTRGDEFICDVLVIDVDAEQSVGVLELVQKQPQVGDSVSTGL